MNHFKFFVLNFSFVYMIAIISKGIPYGDNLSAVTVEEHMWSNDPLTEF